MGGAVGGSMKRIGFNRGGEERAAFLPREEVGPGDVQDGTLVGAELIQIRHFTPGPYVVETGPEEPRQARFDSLQEFPVVRLCRRAE